MSILILDPGAEQQREDEYREALDKAQRGGGEWPMPPQPTAAEIEYAKGIASSEIIAGANFTRTGMYPAMPYPPRERPAVLDESAPPPLDTSFPSRSSFEEGPAASPFTLAPMTKKGR
jgi:hypothetical protein